MPEKVSLKKNQYDQHFPSLLEDDNENALSTAVGVPFPEASKVWEIPSSALERLLKLRQLLHLSSK